MQMTHYDTVHAWAGQKGVPLSEKILLERGLQRGVFCYILPLLTRLA